jgi:hypothetical protein
MTPTEATMLEELDAAIAAHAMWKFKLKTAINGGEIPDPAIVRIDTRCNFGKWLYATTPTGVSAEHHPRVMQLHAEFHEVAARVLLDLQAGKVGDVESVLGTGTPFFVASSKLTNAMMAWRAAL